MHFLLETGHWEPACCSLSFYLFIFPLLSNYCASFFFSLCFPSALFLCIWLSCHLLLYNIFKWFLHDIVFELFSGLTLFFFHHVASVSSFAIVHDTHILADTVHRFSQTYNFNSQHIKRQCSYPVFPWYFDTPWKISFYWPLSYFSIPS